MKTHYLYYDRVTAASVPYNLSFPSVASPPSILPVNTAKVAPTSPWEEKLWSVSFSSQERQLRNGIDGHEEHIRASLAMEQAQQRPSVDYPIQERNTGKNHLVKNR